MSPALFNSIGYDPVDQLRKQDATTRKFALCLDAFLQRAFPSVDPGWISAMCQAWAEMRCCGTEEQIKGMQAARSSLSYQPLSDEEQLMKLIEDRDQQTGAIQQAEDAAAEFPVEGMKGVIEATVISPLRRQLQFTEDRISQLQNALERRAKADAASPESKAEESANA
jgi:hypothetical protein